MSSRRPAPPIPTANGTLRRPSRWRRPWPDTPIPTSTWSVRDIGAYRDLHRHRRCQKFRQTYSGRLGPDTPKLVGDAGAGEIYSSAMESALAAMRQLPGVGAEYLLPFGARSRFLFKMDFAE